MIDLQTAADGVGKLRARHVGGTEGVLVEVRFDVDGPYWRNLDGTTQALNPVHILVIELDDGGRLEAPQRSFEIA